MKTQKGRYRPYRMMLMLTADEKDFITAAAKALGANKSALVRTAAIKAAETILGEQFKEEQHGDR